MFRRRTRRRALRRAEKQFQHIHASPPPDVDTGPARRQVKRMAKDLAKGDVDEAARRIDVFVHGHIPLWQGQVEGRYTQRLGLLERLGAAVDGIVAQLGTDQLDEQGKLAEIEGVVFHLWDRMSEPDLPYIDPIR